MDPIISIALSYLLLYKYLALFVLVFLGSLILPLPDNLILLASGAFASQGVFNLPAVLALTAITTISSDILGYVLTRTYGMAVLGLFRIKEHHITKINRYVTDYTGITIFVTRLAGPFGPAVNFVAGIIKVPWHKFILFDSLGNLADIILYVIAGYLLGNYWLVYSTQIGIVVASIGSLVLIIFIVVRLWKKYRPSRTGDN